MKAILTVSMAALAAYSATITLSNTCTITTTIDATDQSTDATNTGAGQCSIRVPFVRPIAPYGISAGGVSSVSGQLGLVNGWYETPTLRISQYLGSDWDGVAHYRSAVQSTASFAEWIGTGGQIRQGYLQMFTTVARSPMSVLGNYGMSIGGTTGAQMALIPFQLGGISELIMTQAISDWQIGMSSRGNQVSFNGGLRFFEADGVTPVEASVIHNPEPGTWALMVVGLAALFWRTKEKC